MSEYAKANGQQMRFTEEELGIIKATFGGNERLLKLLRKVFLPEFDQSAPLGQTIDLWMAMTNLKELLPDQAYQHIMARNSVIVHIETQLTQLHFLAEQKEESPDQKAAREKKSSAR